MKVQNMLRGKASVVVSVRPETPTRIAIRRLRTENIGAVLVSDALGHMLGIFSERDVVHALAAEDARALDRPVADFMTRSVITCSPDDSIATIMRTMTERRIRHLPVLAEGKLVGIISIRDVVKNRVEEIELENRVLRDAYIATH